MSCGVKNPISRPLVELLNAFKKINLSPSLRSQLYLVDQVFTRKTLTTDNLTDYTKTMHSLTIKITLTFLKFPTLLNAWSNYNNFYYKIFVERYGKILQAHIKRYGTRSNRRIQNQEAQPQQPQQQTAPRADLTIVPLPEQAIPVTIQPLPTTSSAIRQLPPR